METIEQRNQRAKEYLEQFDKKPKKPKKFAKYILPLVIPPLIALGINCREQAPKKAVPLEIKVQTPEILKTITIPEKESYAPEKPKEEPKIVIPTKPQRNAKLVNYTSNELEEITKILYAEAANQTVDAKRAVATVIKNRKESKEYPDSIEKVIYQKNAFSCIGGKLWKQVTGKSPMNAYDERIFEQCKESAKKGLERELDMLDGDKIIAYHDISIKKPNTKYWNSLERTFQIGRLIFYKKAS